ncbi:MAG: M20/M25/M40 family metallo-hydrolase [Acidobacteria bacterium]|nr:M20/M25/M40 family metallo-hydrolase [Acidobacteriota bacterium]
MRFAPRPLLLALRFPVITLGLAAGLLAQSAPQTVAARPDVQRAFAHIESNQEKIFSEWIRVTEISSPSKQEQARMAYMKAAMARIGLEDIQQDEIGNTWGVWKGSGGGPETVLAAHMDTVFPMETKIKVREDNNIYYAPGIGDDTGNLVATLHSIDAMKKAGLKPKGDIIFLATVQEEIGLRGAHHWLTKRARKPDLFVAVDGGLGQVSYGAFRIEQYRFVFEGAPMHTLSSRGQPNSARAAAKAIVRLGEMKLPEPEAGSRMRLPVVNVGVVGGGTVVNAVPASVFFTADIRSLDSPTEAKLVAEVKAIAEQAARDEGVRLRIEPLMEPIDYSQAKPKEDRLAHPLVQTALAASDHLKLTGDLKAEAYDAGAADHNIGVSLGVPAINVGATRTRGAHSLDESAEKLSIIPGAKYLILLMASLAGVN